MLKSVPGSIQDRNAMLRHRANLHYLLAHFGLEPHQTTLSHIDMVVLRVRDKFPNFPADRIHAAFKSPATMISRTNQQKYDAFIDLCNLYLSIGEYIPFGGDAIAKDGVLVKSIIYPTGINVNHAPGIIPDRYPELRKKLDAMDHARRLGEDVRGNPRTEECLTDRCLTEAGRAMLNYPTPLSKQIDKWFDGDTVVDDAVDRRDLEARLGDNPEPELRGDTTFGLNPKWIDWYCATHHTAVWKARKVGKAQLRKLNELKARFNK